MSARWLNSGSASTVKHQLDNYLAYREEKPEVAAEVSAKMVEKNSIVNLQFYPDERDKGQYCSIKVISPIIFLVATRRRTGHGADQGGVGGGSPAQ